MRFTNCTYLRKRNGEQEKKNTFKIVEFTLEKFDGRHFKYYPNLQVHLLAIDCVGFWCLVKQSIVVERNSCVRGCEWQKVSHVLGALVPIDFKSVEYFKSDKCQKKCYK